MKRRMFQQKSANAGFTILEVLIAIAFLAILCFPILGYFRSSTQINALSEGKQTVTLASQKVMEEVVSVGSYEGYLELCADPTYAAQDYRELPKPSGVGVAEEKYYFRRPVDLEGVNYDAYIEMDYEEYKPVVGSGGSQFNSYQNPIIRPMSSSGSILVKERGQNESAVAHFVDLGYNEADVRGGMTREARLTLSEDGPDSEQFYATMEYIYRYDSREYVCPEKLIDDLAYKNSVDGTRTFDGFHWLYTSFDSAEDNLTVVDNLEGWVGEKYTLMLTRQAESAPGSGIQSSNAISPGYKVIITYSGGSQKDGNVGAIFTNQGAENVGGVTVVPVTNSVVERAQVKRIAKVTVSLFPSGTSDEDIQDVGNAIVTMDSAKMY